MRYVYAAKPLEMPFNNRTRSAAESASNTRTNSVQQQYGYPTSNGRPLTAPVYPAHPASEPAAYQQAYHNQPGDCPVMDYSQYGGPYANSQYNYQYPGYDQYAQQQQQYQPPPAIRNPFAPPPVAGSQHDAKFNNGITEQEMAQWQSTYAPVDPYDKSRGAKKDNPNMTALGVRPSAGQENAETRAKVDDGKRKTVVRKGGGETWEDDTLLEWDPSKFRIYVGNLAGEVTDDSLAKAFAAYDVNKARVIRDKRTTKSKGFGFVEFQDHELGFKAAREMVGKYVGSHPITIQKAKTDVNATVHKDKDKRGKHGKNRDRGGNSKDDPLRANTGAHIAKKPVMNTNIKLLG